MWHNVERFKGYEYFFEVMYNFQKIFCPKINYSFCFYLLASWQPNLSMLFYFSFSWKFWKFSNSLLNSHLPCVPFDTRREYLWCPFFPSLSSCKTSHTLHHYLFWPQSREKKAVCLFSTWQGDVASPAEDKPRGRLRRNQRWRKSKEEEEEEEELLFSFSSLNEIFSLSFMLLSHCLVFWQMLVHLFFITSVKWNEVFVIKDPVNTVYNMYSMSRTVYSLYILYCNWKSWKNDFTLWC